VVTPALVDDLEHHLALDLAGGLLAAGQRCRVLCVVGECLVEQALAQHSVLEASARSPARTWSVVLLDLGEQPVELPVFG